ncbi:MAG TPA: hypothetical protein VFI61_00875 [Patescibacteria group bacterium]|nr:hypothetical protein [Patescibacteria group bacterium]
MEKKILNFLAKEHVSALTTILSSKTPHTATMHFGFNSKTFEFVYFTKMTSRKCTSLKIGKKFPASIAVGFDEKKMVEFQAEGQIEMIEKVKSEKYVKVFANKLKGAELDADHIVLAFKPKWWRYTEYKPKFVVIESK